jgi:hypothetical protein
MKTLKDKRETAVCLKGNDEVFLYEDVAQAITELKELSGTHIDIPCAKHQIFCNLIDKIFGDFEEQIK